MPAARPVARAVAVDLPDAVLRGEEPEALGGRTALRRVAIRAVRKQPHNLYGVGDLVEYVPSTPQARSLETRQSVLEPVLAEAGGWIAQDPQRLERVLAAGIHSPGRRGNASPCCRVPRVPCVPHVPCVPRVPGGRAPGGSVGTPLRCARR